MNLSESPTAQPIPRGLPVATPPSRAKTTPHRCGPPVLRALSCACMPTPLPRRDHGVRSLVPPPSRSGGERLRDGGLPRRKSGSAPALPFSRFTRRSLTFRPARSLNPYGPFDIGMLLQQESFLSLRLLPAGATQLPGGTNPTGKRRSSRRALRVGLVCDRKKKVVSGAMFFEFRHHSPLRFCDPLTREIHHSTLAVQVREAIRG